MVPAQVQRDTFLKVEDSFESQNEKLRMQKRDQAVNSSRHFLLFHFDFLISHEISLHHAQHISSKYFPD